MTKKEPKALEQWQADDAARLKALFEGPGNARSQLKFGAEFDIGSPGMVWQYISGYRPLNIRAAVSFARGLNCKIEDFSPTIAAEIAEAMSYARTTPQPGDLGDTELHRLSKVEVHIVTRFRLTDDDGREAILDTADTVPLLSANLKKQGAAGPVAREGGG